MARKLNLALPSKGLVVDRPGEFVDPLAAVNIKNMEFNRYLIRKRMGTEAMGSTLAQRVQRVFELVDGGSTRLFRVGTTKVEVYNKTTDVWSSATATPLTGGETDMVSYAFPDLAGAKVAVYSNGIDAIRKCSTSGMDAALGGTPPKARHLQAYGPYLVLGNVIDGGNNFPRRVQWCDTGDPESWTPAGDSNAGSVELLEDAEDITGMGVFAGFLTVHKANSIYVGGLVTTADVFRFERKQTGVGTCAGATIQSLPSGEQIFLGSDGIHVFNGVTAPLIESPVQDELREQMNPAYLYKAQSVFVKELDEYWVCVAMGSDTEPRTVYKYNWRTKMIYKDDRAGLTALGLFLNTSEETWDDAGSDSWDSDTGVWDSATNTALNPIVIFGDSAGVTTKRSGATNDDNGAAVEAIWETKDFNARDLGETDMDRIVRWLGMEVWAIGSSVKVYYSTDGGDTWALASTLALTSSYPIDGSPLNSWFDAISSRIRFRFVNSAAGESFTLKQYQPEGQLREARK